MSQVPQAWVEGVLLGLSIAAPFGPINVEIIRRHLSRGMAAGLLLGLGACSVDTVYIVLISLLIQFGTISVGASLSPSLHSGLLLLGALILVALAAIILRSATASARVAAGTGAASREGPAGPLRHYAVGIVMTASSPMNLVFWLGVVASGQYLAETAWGPWPRVVGVMCGTAGWVVGFNLALARGRRFLRPGLLAAINVICGLALLGFAAWAVRSFLIATR